jgi:hypothetical protein
LCSTKHARKSKKDILFLFGATFHLSTRLLLTHIVTMSHVLITNDAPTKSWIVEHSSDPSYHCPYRVTHTFYRCERCCRVFTFIQTSHLESSFAEWEKRLDACPADSLLTDHTRQRVTRSQVGK